VKEKKDVKKLGKREKLSRSLILEEGFIWERSLITQGESCAVLLQPGNDAFSDRGEA